MTKTAPGTKTSQSRRPGNGRNGGIRTLAVDIGGTGIKTMVLDPAGKPLTERLRLPTPAKATPKGVVAVIRKLAAKQGPFDRVSVGFPGVIKDGIVYTAANLGKGWKGFDLQTELKRRLKRPVMVANDADVQGLGCVNGHGVELVVTLGTGFGSVIFVDGHRIHLELGHHPFHKGRTYEDELGNRALQSKGKKKWNRLVRDAINDLRVAFNYDRLYIGGGNSKQIKFRLPPDVEVISNLDGLLGGINLWREEAKSVARPRKARSAVSAKPARAKKPAESVAPIEALSADGVSPTASNGARGSKKPASTGAVAS